MSLALDIWPTRLPQHERRMIHETVSVEDHCAESYLRASRLGDNRRGGDIDLYIETALYTEDALQIAPRHTGVQEPQYSVDEAPLVPGHIAARIDKAGGVPIQPQC